MVDKGGHFAAWEEPEHFSAEPGPRGDCSAGVYLCDVDRNPEGIHR